MAGHGEKEANGKAKGGLGAEEGGGGGGDVLILNCEALVVEQRFDDSGELGRIELVDGIDDPDCFGKGEERDPSAVFDKGGGG